MSKSIFRTGILFLSIFIYFHCEGQIIVGPVIGNPALKIAKSLESRDFPVDKRVVLTAGVSQQICLYVPYPGFDSLRIDSVNCSPAKYSSVEINGRCITITADAGAPESSENICFNYFREDTLPYRINVLVDIVKSKKLPFFDDFSTSSVYPDPTLWVDNDVFINNTMAYQPPSIGVATFDGLNSHGSPYGGGFGRADYLTSTYLDLRGTGDVYLSYYIQPKGNMYFHEERDSLILELKTADGKWHKGAEYKGIENGKPASFIPPFELKYLLLSDEYRYNGFQFRFVNYSYRLGVYSTWHLDYVRVEANRFPEDGINDIALMNEPGKFFSQFTQIPYKQFEGHELELVNDTTYINVWNHYNTKENSESSNYKISEITTGKILLDNKVLLEDPQTQRDLTPGPHFFKNPFDKNLITGLNELSYSGTPLIIRQEYDVNDVQDEFKSNNKAHRDSKIGKIMAYDDGTAEMHMTTPAYTNLKTQIALKFHLNVADTLQGVQFMFPRIYSDVSNQLFNLKVWVGSLDKEPDYIYELRKPIYPDALFDTLQGFTSYPLIDNVTQEMKPLFIPAGDFYIGWQQVSVSSSDQYIPVGIDRNFQGGEELTFFKADDKWISFKDLNLPALRGIAMIRAVFDHTNITSKNRNARADLDISLYPNPAKDVITLSSSLPIPLSAEINIYDAVGRCIFIANYSEKVNINQLVPGIYLLSLKDKGALVWNKKFIKL